MIRPRILVADDEMAIIKFLRANLEVSGYQTLAALDGAQALQIAERELPDLIILDIMMPQIDGFEVLRRLRQWSNLPIIMLSARSDADDKVQCLDLGADDYLAKPFDIGELLARINAVFRRIEAKGAKPALPAFTSGDLHIDFAARRVTIAGKDIKLTPTEYTLLQELVLNAGKVLTHSHLLNKVWGAEYRDEKEYLHVYVGRLRHKLESVTSHHRYITTVPGIGYQFTRAAKYPVPESCPHSLGRMKPGIPSF